MANRTLEVLHTPDATLAISLLQQAPQRMSAKPADAQRFFAVQNDVLRVLNRGLERLEGPASQSH